MLNVNSTPVFARKINATNTGTRFFIVLLITSLTLFSACRNKDDGDTSPPNITLTSHTDGQDVTGSRDIIVTGAVSNDTTSISMMFNGTDAAFTQPDSSSFASTTLTLANQANSLVVTATDSTGNSSTRTFILNYPFLPFDNGQLASIVIGQADFVSDFSNNDGPTPIANGLDSPSGNPTLSPSGELLITDTRNHRILVFNQLPSTNGASADAVIGQADFSSNELGTTATSLAYPEKAIVLPDNKLVVTDGSNNRILIWNQMPADTTQVGADVVIGQTGFDLSEATCSATSLIGPKDTMIIDNKLIVSDTDNHRVLIWNTLPASNVQADLVLGQQRLDTCVANDSDGDGLSEDATISNPDGLPRDTTLRYPFDVWSDGQRLIVSDAGNNRVLIWNNFPTSNGQRADVVLGQANMNTNTVLPVSSTSLNNPVSMTSNGNQLFVGLRGDPRVMIWDEIPAANNTPADRILGQIAMTGQDPFQGTARGVSQQIMDSVESLLVGSNQLIVSDGGNNRVLIFNTP
jgi:hypothetical protein